MLQLIRMLSGPDNSVESANWQHFRFVFTAEAVQPGYNINTVRIEGNSVVNKESFSFASDSARVNIV